MKHILLLLCSVIIIGCGIKPIHIPSQSPTLEEDMDDLIAFVGYYKKTTSIGLIESDGQYVHYLTDEAGNEVLPKWSPNGQYIAYLSDRQILDEDKQQYYDLWLWSLTDKQSVRLTQMGQVSAYLTSFVWSPDSGEIMYNSSDIGVNIINLISLSTDTIGSHFKYPFAWSTKDKLALTDRYIFPQAIFSLAILDSNHTPILPPQDHFRAGGHYSLNTANSLNWHPDGEQLAIGSYFALRGDSDLRIVSIKEDTIVVQASLAETFGDEEFKYSFPPSIDIADVIWSPDGNQIAFRLIETDTERIYVTNSTLNTMLAITPADKLCNYPQWSADSTRLVFACRGLTENDKYDLWIAHADGSDLHPLTQTPDVNEETPMWHP